VVTPYRKPEKDIQVYMTPNAAEAVGRGIHYALEKLEPDGITPGYGRFYRSFLEILEDAIDKARAGATVLLVAKDHHVHLAGWGHVTKYPLFQISPRMCFLLGTALSFLENNANLQPETMADVARARKELGAADSAEGERTIEWINKERA